MTAAFTVTETLPKNFGKFYAPELGFTIIRIRVCPSSANIIVEVGNIRLERVRDTDLILRSLRSKRLEGWTQRTDPRSSFETRAKARSSG
jgi:hypothetical protein